jgi:flavin reductase (DIM6/NTAB) family NADH-FMN oxidoreductase RutF
VIQVDAPGHPPAEPQAAPDDGPDLRCCAPDADEFRRFMSLWPTGVAVVTTTDRNTPAGCTVNAVMSVSLAPPLLLVALTTGSATLAAIRRTGTFALNLLAQHQGELCRRFAAGSQPDRFRGLACQWHGRLPLLPDVVAVAICTVDRTVPCGDHVLVIGAPVWQADGGREPPLVFHRRRYLGLAGAQPC